MPGKLPAHGPFLRSSDEDLSICPICFGHTTVVNGKVYCPNDKVFISENPADAMRTKVRFIKTNVDTVKQEKIAKSHHTVLKAIIASLFSLALTIAIFIFGIVGYEIVRAKAFEATGDYTQAQLAYKRSEFLFKVPQADSSIARLDVLVISSQNFSKGQAAMQQQKWQQAIFYFTLVDPGDIHYSQAQQDKRVASEKLQALPK